MRKLLWLIVGWAVLIGAVFVVNLGAGRPPSAKERARAYFGMPAGATVDTTTLRAAVLRRLRFGTPRADVAAFLARPAIARDSLTWFEPDAHDTSMLLRINGATRGLELVRTDYAVFFRFGPDGRLGDVDVHEWRTGP